MIFPKIYHAKIESLAATFDSYSTRAWQLTSEGCLACHIHCKTGNRFNAHII